MIKRFFLLFFILITTVSCLKQPVLYKENTITINKPMLNAICQQINQHFADYSCSDYFEKDYELKADKESIHIKLLKDKIIFFYQTKSDNGPLYDQYKSIITALDKD